MNPPTVITAQEIRHQPGLRHFDVENDSDLELFSYADCNDASSDLVKACRGIVISGETIVSRAFGYTKEYSYPQHAAELRELFTTSFDPASCLFYPAVEGSIVRLFFYRGGWRLSTFRKLDAFASKWQSRHTFGDLFKQGLANTYTTNPDFRAWVGDASDAEQVYTAFLARLEPSLTHTFILPSTKETRQCAAGSDMQEVLYTGSFSTLGQFFKVEEMRMPRVAWHTFTTVDEAMLNIQQLHSRIEAGLDQSQGAMVILPNHTMIKIASTAYSSRRKIRGNTPSVTHRYIDVYHDPLQRDELKALYPERVTEFTTIDDNIRSVVRAIHRTYMDRHIHKQRIVVHPLLNFIDKELHERHKSTGDRITPAVVEAAVIRQPPKYLHQLAQLGAAAAATM